MTRSRHHVVARQSIRGIVVTVDAGVRDKGAVPPQSVEQGLLTHVYATAIPETDAEVGLPFELRPWLPAMFRPRVLMIGLLSHELESVQYARGAK